MIEGLSYVLAAGVLQGIFLLPMDYIRGWRWEQSWLAFALFGMLIFNWIFALAMVPHIADIYHAAPVSDLGKLALFGFGWGLGAVLFGLGMARLEFALGYPIIMGLIASLVAVQLTASGIRHTDLAAVRDARVVPMVLGHEGAGYVEAVGEHVRHLKEGDRVVINWQPKCGHCRQCQTGRADFCDGITGTSQPRLHWRGQPVEKLLNAGTFCPLAVVPAAGAVPIPKEMPFDTAAMLGCAVATGVGAALYTAKIAPGDTVVVIGAGAVGLNVVQGARLAQASIIIAVDLDSSRLDMARRLGATHAVSSKDNDFVAQVRDLTSGRGVEHVFEAVGNPQTMAQGIDLLARGGALTLVGAASRDALFAFAPRRFMSQQQTVRGCIYGNIHPKRDLPLFARWYLDGRLEIDALLSERITLTQVPALFAANANTTRRGIRTIVEFS